MHVAKWPAVLVTVVLVLAGCTGTGGASPSAGSKDPVTIGMVMGLTGYLNLIDKPFVDGARLAVDYVNSSGGAGGHLLQLSIKDGASDPGTGVTTTNQLISEGKMTVMMNGASSATNAALVPVVSKPQIPVISQAQLPPDPKWMVLATAWFQKDLEVQLGFAKERLNAKSIVFLYSQTPYGQLGVKAIDDVAAKLGLSIALKLAVDASSTDLTSVMSRVKDAHSDAVIDFLTGSTHIVEGKAATTVNLGVPLIMGIDANAPIQTATQSYANTYYVAPPTQTYPNIPDAGTKAAAKTFIDAYSAGGYDLGLVGTAGYGWDGILMLKAAIEKCGCTSGEPLRAALENVNVQGSMGPYKFTPQDHTGQAAIANPLVIAQWKGNELNVVYQAK